MRISPWAYGLGYFAFMLPSTAFSMFYTFYYVDHLGLTVTLYAIARVIYVLWDAIAQPLAGFLSDRTRTRWGRRIPWLIGAIPIYAIVFIGVFSVPGGIADAGLFWWFLAFQLSFEATMAVIYVNFLSLFPELYKGDRARAKASVIQQAFYIIALLVGTAATPLIYTALGFSNMAIAYGLTFAVFMTLTVLLLKEDPRADHGEPLGFVESFKITLGTPAFWWISLSNTFAAAVLGIISAAMAFYAKYVLSVEGAELSILMAVTFLSVIPMAVIWYVLINRFGSLLSWKVSVAVLGACVIPLYFATDLATGVIAGAVLSFGLAGHFVVPQLVLSNLIDVDAERTGKRREGIYMAVSNFLVRSSALLTAIGFWVVGILFGYVSGEEPGPNPAATFRFLTAIVPLGFIAVSLAFALLVKPRDVTVTRAGDAQPTPAETGRDG